MRLLLHACCGPCLIEPLDALRDAHDVVIAYANPNIHPGEEYVRRRETLEAYAETQETPVVELPYDAASWVRAVGPRAGAGKQRCAACFALRLGLVARHAAAGEFDGFATTLTVSPYQDAGLLRVAADAAATHHGVPYVHTDFRERYPEAMRRARELGMYRQNYCGCLLSHVEAACERAERTAARKERRAKDITAG